MKQPRATRKQAQATADKKTAAAAADDRTLGEYVVCYVSQFQTLGWNNFITGCRLPTDFASNVQQLPHRAARLLDHLQCHGASVPKPPLSGPHNKSAVEHLAFLQEEILSMMQKGQWILLHQEWNHSRKLLFYII
jgi:hypothetical protein